MPHAWAIADVCVATQNIDFAHHVNNSAEQPIIHVLRICYAPFMEHCRSVCSTPKWALLTPCDELCKTPP